MIPIVGDKFLMGEAEVNADTIVKAKLVGLYFSAQWCPPCQHFTPILSEFYKDVNANESQLEIIFVSFDKDKTKFNEYRSTMPWLAIPFGDKRIQALQEKYGIIGIPHLLILDSNGSILIHNGRPDVQKKGVVTFEEWISKLPK
jgi:nucleoredoxin